MAEKPSYYVTTPIYYVNAAPHLGTAYCTLLADVQARFRRAAGYDVKFLTGMDEHGEKVAEAAAQHDMTPQQWCDSQAPLFQDLWQELEVSNDDFIRTTEPRQHHAVQYLWDRMLESGYLYKGSYDGWYCVPEETYFTETQVEKADEELQALRLPGPPAQALRRAPRLRPARLPHERGAQLRRGRPAGHLGLPHDLRLGHQGAL